MKIKKIIEHVTTYLPTTWPLQSFIAMNPLWDRVNSQSIIAAINETKNIFSVRGTLSLKQYHKLHQKNEINSIHLKTVVTDWLKQHGLIENFNKNSEFFDEATLLYDFLLASETQQQLEVLDQNKNEIDSNAFKKMNSLHSDQVNYIRDNLIKWCAAFFDLGQAIWPLPTESNNLFMAWRELIVLESSHWKKIIKSLPCGSIEALEFLVHKLGVPEQKLESYFLQILSQLLGWASLIKWLQAKPKNNYTKKTASIIDLITMWLAYEVYLLETTSSTIIKSDIFQADNKNNINLDLEKIWHNWLTKARSLINTQSELSALNLLADKLDLFSIRWIWQTTWEKSYQYDLINLLQKQLPGTQKDQSKKDFQAVFCIDTRSEGLRRHLEASSHWETFGFAGFFGFPFQWRDEISGCQVSQSPPLIDPEIILEFIQQQSTHEMYQQASNFLNIMGLVKTQGLAPFALFELIGSWLSLKLISKTLFPRLYQYYAKNKKSSLLSIAESISNQSIAGFNIDQATDSAEAFLKTIGLIKKFSRIVLICAHGATTDNNPYQSSFDCGACGGNAGTPNAMIACRILNHPIIRKKLIDRQIHIPKDTQFIPACHNTTTDTVDILIDIDTEKNFEIHLKTLQEDLSLACNRLRQERLKSLPGKSNVNNRQANWAELIPELGLVNNAAMIIAPRSLTRELDLHRRVFLHSYDASLDHTGIFLENILTAPVIIAHWINAQYYFSTTDPHLYGSGNKTIHNVVSKLGVMEGNRGDLKVGLPLQNVYFQGELLHQPLKLLVVIVAKRLLVDQLLDKHPEVKNIFDGQWAYLHVIETEEENHV